MEIKLPREAAVGALEAEADGDGGERWEEDGEVGDVRAGGRGGGEGEEEEEEGGDRRRRRCWRHFWGGLGFWREEKTLARV